MIFRTQTSPPERQPFLLKRLLRRSNIFLLLVLFWGFGYLLLFGNNSLLYHFILQNRIKNVLSEINRLETDNLALSQEINRVKNDRQHMEFIVRKLGYIRPSEKAYRIETVPAGLSPAASVRQKKQSTRFLQVLILTSVIAGLAAVLFILRLRSGARRSSSRGVLPHG